MTKFTNALLGETTSQLNLLYQKRFKHMSPQDILSDDMFKLLVAPDHRQFCIDSVSLGIGTYQNRSTKLGSDIHVQIKNCAPLPHYAGLRMYNDTQWLEDLAKRIEEFTDESKQLREVYREGIALLNAFHRNNMTLETIRFFFPGIIVLLNQTEWTKPYAMNVAEQKVPSNIPKLQNTTKALCKQLTTELTLAGILPDISLDTNSVYFYTTDLTWWALRYMEL